MFWLKFLTFYPILFGVSVGDKSPGIKVQLSELLGELKCNGCIKSEVKVLIIAMLKCGHIEAYKDDQPECDKGIALEAGSSNKPNVMQIKKQIEGCGKKFVAELNALQKKDKSSKLLTKIKPDDIVAAFQTIIMNKISGGVPAARKGKHKHCKSKDA